PGARDALDGPAPGAIALPREHQAAAHDHAVDAQRAGATDAVFAADMAAGEAEGLAQEIDDGLPRIDALAHRLAVDRDRDLVESLAHGRGSMSCFATRRVSTPARGRLPARRRAGSDLLPAPRRPPRRRRRRAPPRLRGRAPA